MNEVDTTSYEAVRLPPPKDQAKPVYKSQVPFSRDTLDALEELGKILQCVRKEMIEDGYEIVDGVVRKVATPPM
jgi:hypothetical protein